LLVMALPVALPWLAIHGLPSLEATRGNSMAPLLHIVAGITVAKLFVSLAGLLCVLPEVRVPTSHVSWFSGMRVIWRNGPFKRLILVNIFNGMGWTVCGTLVVFYVRYILEAGLAATGW